MFLGRDYWFGNVCVVAVITGLLLCIEGSGTWIFTLSLEEGITDLVQCVMGQRLVVWYCVLWGNYYRVFCVWWCRDYWSGTVCIWTVNTCLVLYVVT